MDSDDTAQTKARPTTKDLARVAGVSRATVDRVLNGRQGVKAHTIARVNAAIEQLGFVRNLSAANLAKSRAYRFVFVLPRSGDQFLAEILRHIHEAEAAFASDMVWMGVERVDDNDPHAVAAFLSALTPARVDGVAIMAPETPPVRDAIARLGERGIHAVPFVSDQSRAQWVGIDNRAAGRTAGLLLGRFAGGRTGDVLVVGETMKSRDSLERRAGFDEVLGERFPALTPLPSLETYGSERRARDIIRCAVGRNPNVVGAYVLSSEPRIPLAVLGDAGLPDGAVRIAHERTPCTEAALADGSLDAVIAQSPGHLVRSAIRKLRALTDGRGTLDSQEKIRIEVLLATNL